MNAKKAFPVFELFIAGSEMTAANRQTISHIRRELEEAVGKDYQLKVTDILSRSGSDAPDEVFATPTLLRIDPEPKLSVYKNWKNVRDLIRKMRVRLPRIQAGRKHVFRLFVAEKNTPKNLQVESALNAALTEVYEDGYFLEVLDVLENPGEASRANVLITPAFQRIYPEPVLTTFGQLTDGKKALKQMKIL